MTNIVKYRKQHEPALLALLAEEPDWRSFLTDSAIATFKEVLLKDETLVCESHGTICGYLRALIDGFGIYVSELYVAPQHRGHGFGEKLLASVKLAYPNQDVYVFSDEDLYYEKLGCKRVGSVFQL